MPIKSYDNSTNLETKNKDLEQLVFIDRLALLTKAQCLETSFQIESKNNDKYEYVLKRLFGENTFISVKNIATKQLRISEIGEKYCYPKNPNCKSCLVSSICFLGKSKLTSEPQLETLQYADLFCGAGGLSVGLEAHGLNAVIAIDNDLTACKTYAFNRPKLDTKNIISASIDDFIKTWKGEHIPIVVGGPPCQGFSNANRQPLKDDPRNILYKDYLEFLHRAKSNICIMENVPGMLKASEAVISDFREIGFSVKSYLVDAKDYGYPQSRKRLFWFGVNDSLGFNFDKLAEIFENNLMTRRTEFNFTLADAISDLPQLTAKSIKNATDVENGESGYTVSNFAYKENPYLNIINKNRYPRLLFNHRSKYNNTRDIEIYSILKPGENSSAESIQHIMPYKDRQHIFKDKFYKLEPNKPCKTITAHMYYDCHMYIHPSQSRGLSPREAARVQGFPDDYVFLGQPNQWYRQIGNAVSPLVAWHLGRALKAVVNEMTIKKL